MPYYVSAESAFGVYRHSTPEEPLWIPRKRRHQNPRPAAGGDLADIAYRLESAMKSDNIRDVRSACSIFLASASNFYEVPTCGVRVLAARPLRTREHGTFELFGDYAPDSMLIRVWMRTAVRKEVTSFGTFVSTLYHEFCPRFSEIRVHRFMAHSRLLRASGCSVPSCCGKRH